MKEKQHTWKIFSIFNYVTTESTPYLINFPREYEKDPDISNTSIFHKPLITYPHPPSPLSHGMGTQEQTLPHNPRSRRDTEWLLNNNGGLVNALIYFNSLSPSCVEKKCAVVRTPPSPNTPKVFDWVGSCLGVQVKTLCAVCL